MSLHAVEQGAETIIVGGGIVGCAIAYHLAEKGYTDVVVLDRGKVQQIGSPDELDARV